MRLFELGPAPGARRRRRRLARGNAGSGGTYAGRGRKGQKARSGGVKAPYFEGGQLPLVRRLPYRRGFHRLRRMEFAAVNLADLERLFESGAEVTPTSLTQVGMLRSPHEPFKVLGDGELSRPLRVHAPRFSKAAERAIAAAGGECVVLDSPLTPAGLGRRRKRR